ncbi:hypothetical protein PG987_003121 [Apiospora arundinis]
MHNCGTQTHPSSLTHEYLLLGFAWLLETFQTPEDSTRLVMGKDSKRAGRTAKRFAQLNPYLQNSFSSSDSSSSDDSLSSSSSKYSSQERTSSPNRKHRSTDDADSGLEGDIPIVIQLDAANSNPRKRGRKLHLKDRGSHWSDDSSSATSVPPKKPSKLLGWAGKSSNANSHPSGPSSKNGGEQKRIKELEEQIKRLNREMTKLIRTVQVAFSDYEAAVRPGSSTA